jgi:peptidyl-tRNA hydrolase
MDGTSSEVCAKGGNTEIQLTSPDKTINVSGKSVCSEKENYNRKVGNSIALGRAWKEYEALSDSLVNE